MESAVKFLLSLGLLCLMLPCSLWADTIYTYTGNTDGLCEGVYYCNGTRQLSMSITFDVPLAGDQLDNLPLGPVPVSSFSITDGTGLYITQANAVDVNRPVAFDISTTSTGAIFFWSIVVQAYELFPPTLGYLQFISQNPFPDEFGLTYDESTVWCSICGVGDGVQDGYNSAQVGIDVMVNPGVWSSSSSTLTLESSSSTPAPEPSTLLLLGGLLSILVLWAVPKDVRPLMPSRSRRN